MFIAYICHDVDQSSWAWVPSVLALFEFVLLVPAITIKEKIRPPSLVWVLSQNKSVTLVQRNIVQIHLLDSKEQLRYEYFTHIFSVLQVIVNVRLFEQKIWNPRHSQATLLMMETTLVESSLNTLWLISSCIAVYGRIFLCKYSNWHIVDHYDRSDTVLLCKMKEWVSGHERVFL